MDSDLGYTWCVNNRANYQLLEAIPEGAMGSKYSERTRTVASQFAHIHNIRLAHIEKRGPDFFGDLQSYPRGAEPTKEEMLASLKASEEAMSDLLSEAEKTGTVKGWSAPPTSFLGYLIAHEGHHRGLVIVSLRLSGIKLPKDVLYGLWNWSKKLEG